MRLELDSGGKWTFFDEDYHRMAPGQVARGLALGALDLVLNCAVFIFLLSLVAGVVGVWR